MGSLVPSWDTTAPGVPPKGWKDYDEPVTPRAPCRDPFKRETTIKQGELARQLSRQPSGPPSLHRASCPTPVRLGPLQRSATLGSPRAAARSTTMPMTPRSPGSPRSPSSPRGVGSAPSNFLTRYFEFGEGEEVDLKQKEKWCDRLDSHVLNERPDEGDEMAWRHGNFKPQHTVAQQHLEPVNEQRPKVTVERVEEGLQRLSMDTVKTPVAQPRGGGRAVSP